MEESQGGSPICAYWNTQELNTATNRHKPGWMDNFEAEREKAKQHVTFCCFLYRYPIDQGRHFVHEHPWSAMSWALTSIQRLLNHPSVQVAQAHMCRSLMETHIDHRGGQKGLVKKPTGFMSSSSRYIIQELDRKCTGESYTSGERTRGRSRHLSAGTMRGHLQRDTTTEKDGPQ